MNLAHFGSQATFRAHRTLKYGWLTVLASKPNCTQVHPFFERKK
jgi:hypothetical protein